MYNMGAKWKTGLAKLNQAAQNKKKMQVGAVWKR